jgi:hypothetical protein
MHILWRGPRRGASLEKLQLWRKEDAALRIAMSSSERASEAAEEEDDDEEEEEEEERR